MNITHKTSRYRGIAIAATLATTASLVGGTAGFAATKKVVTTKKGAKAVVLKTTTTKHRLAPKAASGSKRSGDLWQPNGRPPAEPLVFDPHPPSKDANNPSTNDENAALSKVQPGGGVFSILIVGTDARPGEKPEKTRGDSIHVFTYNPTLKKGSLLGFPRDSYVTSPGGSTRKINEIMSTEGPDAFLATVNSLTGLKTQRWVLTGFQGFTKLVDGVGGVNVNVEQDMNDPFSGAQFAKGWFQFNGDAALAFARARKTLPNGDFARSANQAKLMIAGFDRLRESTDNIRALLNWVLVLKANTVSNVKPTDWMYLAQVARSIPGSAVNSVVASGTPETVDGSDVVKLDQAKLTAIAADLQDGVLGN